MILKLIARLRRHGLRSSWMYFLGRFEWVRTLRRNSCRAFSKPAPVIGAGESMVEPFDIDDAMASLAKDSIFTGLRLPLRVLSQLLSDIDQSEQRDAHASQPPVNADVLARTDALHDPVLIVNYQSARLAETCQLLAHDPCLLTLATRFLGRAPRKKEVRVQRSRVVVAAVPFRESKNQTVMFHYDVHDLDFLYVFFYLSDTTSDSGAHELMRGTHRSKKLRHLFASARQEDLEIYETYGRDRALVIEGSAGAGFIEDTSCFHRALAPTKAERLALQIRYS